MVDKLADQISYLIAGAGWHLEAEIKASAGPSHIPVEQWRVLALLEERNGRTMGDLAHHAFLEPPTLTKMVDRMVADALVYRVPDSQDRRRILIFFSARGHERFLQLQAVIAAHEKRVLQRMGRSRIAALKRLLRDFPTAQEPRSTPIQDSGFEPVLTP